MDDPVSLDDQIACVARELALRRSAYPKWVANGRMKQSEAEREVARMTAVIETLKGLRWIPAAETLPDDDLTVLLMMEDGEVWTGYHDGDAGWHYVSADPAGAVKAWRAMPS